MRSEKRTWKSWWLIFCSILLLVLTTVAAGADYYSLLGVARGASKQDIKKAYRQMSHKYHPDKNPNNKKAEEKYIEINHAYEVLTDDDKRRVYDQFGEDGLKQDGGGGGGGFPAGHPFAGFFGNLFQQAHGGRHRGPPKGNDVQLNIEVSLEDFYMGAHRHLDVNKQIICEACKGTGALKPDDVHTCSVCQGQGVRVQRVQIAPGFIQQMQSTCDNCHGTGRVFKNKCAKCKGARVVRGTKSLNLDIEKGCPENHPSRIPHAADEIPDVESGDVILMLRSRPHPVFRREGDDLHMEMTLSIKEALLGFEKHFNHLDGKEWTVTKSEHSITQPESTQEIAGGGMPLFHHSYAYGKLFVHYHVKLPTSLTPRQKEVLKEFF